MPEGVKVVRSVQIYCTVCHRPFLVKVSDIEELREAFPDEYAGMSDWDVAEDAWNTCKECWRAMEG